MLVVSTIEDTKVICFPNSGIISGNSQLVDLALSKMEAGPNILVSVPPRLRSSFILSCNDSQPADLPLLSLAIKRSTSKIVSRLVSLGASVSQRDAKNRTPLHQLFLPSPDFAKERLVLENSRRPAAADFRSDLLPVRDSLVTPRVAVGDVADRAGNIGICAHVFAEGAANETSEIANILCSAGAELEACDASGATAISHAQKWLREGCVEMQNLELSLEERIAASQVRAAALTVLAFENQLKVRLLAPLATTYQLVGFLSHPEKVSARGKGHRFSSTSSRRCSVNRRASELPGIAENIMSAWSGSNRVCLLNSNSSDEIFDLKKTIDFNAANKSNPGLLGMWEFLGAKFRI